MRYPTPAHWRAREASAPCVLRAKSNTPDYSHILMQVGPTVFCNVCGCNDGSARVMGLAEPCLRRASERQLEGLRRLRRGLHPTRSVVLGEPARLAGRGRPRSRSRDRREAAASGERGEGAASGARGRGGA